MIGRLALAITPTVLWGVGYFSPPPLDATLYIVAAGVSTYSIIVTLVYWKDLNDG